MMYDVCMMYKINDTITRTQDTTPFLRKLLGESSTDQGHSSTDTRA